MSVNRGGRPVTHASAWLAKRLETNRLEPRIKRLLKKIQTELHADTWPTVRALVLGRLARRELLIQQREAALLTDPNAEGGQWLLGMWNAQRRDTETLALIERIPDPSDRIPALDEYLRARSTGTSHSAAPAAPRSTQREETDR